MLQQSMIAFRKGCRGLARTDSIPHRLVLAAKGSNFTNFISQMVLKAGRGLADAVCIPQKLVKTVCASASAVCIHKGW